MYLDFKTKYIKYILNNYNNNYHIYIMQILHHPSFASSVAKIAFIGNKDSSYKYRQTSDESIRQPSKTHIKKMPTNICSCGDFTQDGAKGHILVGIRLYKFVEWIQTEQILISGESLFSTDNVSDFLA